MPVTSELVKTREVREATTTLTFASTTSAEKFKLPKNTRIIMWILNVTTAFSGGTTTIDIGTESDSDYYVDGAALGSLGQTIPSTLVLVPGPEPTAVAPIYMNVGASNTVGSVEVTCLFSMKTDKRF